MGEIIFIIKKYINSDLTKSLNTMIDEVKSTLALIKTKTDTITSNLFTATHASRIDANISSRQASWGATSTHADRIDASISSRALETTAQAIKDLLSAGALSGNVKSIQSGQLLGASVYSGTGIDLSYVDITISPVNISKCVIFSEIGFGTNHLIAGTVSGNNSNSTYNGLARLISSTKLRIHNSCADSANAHGSWTVVEYY